MNVKKLAVIVVLALVVIGCVVAAGCTSTTTETTTTTTTTSDDQILGTWVKEDGTAAFVIVADNDGTYYTIKDDAVDEEISILWTKNADGTYALINGDAKATVTLDTVKGQFTTDSGSVFVKQASDASGSFWEKIKKAVVNAAVDTWNVITGNDPLLEQIELAKKGIVVRDLGNGFYATESHF